MELQKRLEELAKQPEESEWLAFEHNYHADEVRQCITYI